MSRFSPGIQQDYSHFSMGNPQPRQPYRFIRHFNAITMFWRNGPCAIFPENRDIQIHINKT